MQPFPHFLKEALDSSPVELQATHTLPILLQKEDFPIQSNLRERANLDDSDPHETLRLEQPPRPAEPRQGEKFPRMIIFLDEPEIAIGRHPTSGIRIPDFTISTHHALLVRTSSGYLLTDRGSKNGTFVGRDRLKPNSPRLLKDRDRISFAEMPFDYLEPKTFLAVVEKMIADLGGRF